MKKNISILFSILLLFLLVSCSSNASSQKSNENSDRTYTTLEFQDYLNQLPEEEENGKQTILKASMEDNNTINVILNNTESGTYSNMLIVEIFDTAIRSHYKDSDYYTNEEPTIVFYNLNDEIVYEGNALITFSENDAGGF